MARKAQSPLQSAIGGDIEKLNDKQTRSALTEAVGKLSRVTKLAETSKEQVIDTGTALMHSAETMGSLFISSMAEGFFGPDKLQLGGVDVRAPAGLLMQGYGLYQVLSGESGGEHFLSLGNGVTGSWLASVGQDAGRALRDRRNGQQPTSSPAPVPTQAQTTPAMRGEEPMVHVPALEGQYGPVYGGAAAFGGPGLLRPPGMAAGFLPAAGWPPGYAQSFAPGQYAPGEAPQMSGPVREILPAEEAPGAGYYPAPFPGYADGATSGRPAGVMAGPPAGPGFPYPQPVMQFTPEAAPDSVQGPRLRMRLTPEAAPRRPAAASPGAPEGGVAGAVRPERRARDAARDGEDIQGQRPHRTRARDHQDNRFPRARRADDELEAK